MASVTGLLAVVSLSLVGALGSIHGPASHERMFAAGGAVGFLACAVIANPNVANELGRMLSPRTGPSHAEVVRWVIRLAGYAIVLLTYLTLETAEGPLALPNALVLGSGIGPQRVPVYPDEPQPPASQMPSTATPRQATRVPTA